MKRSMDERAKGSRLESSGAGRSAGQLRRAALALALCWPSGCAHRLEPAITSSAAESGYALRYPEQLAEASTGFEQDKARARALAADLPARTASLARSGDRALLAQVIDEADAAGRSQRFARAEAEQRALRAFWESERGGLAARATSATEKPLTEANCGQVELQGPIGQALREGFDRQLDRRLRAENEAHRTLEQHKPALPAASFSALSRLADDTAAASYLVHVALVEDAKELERLRTERGDVEATLERGLDRERTLQGRPLKPQEQRASQERVVQLEKARTALPAAHQQAEAQLHEVEEQLDGAREQYERTLASMRSSARDAAAAPAQGGTAPSPFPSPEETREKTKSVAH